MKHGIVLAKMTSKLPEEIADIASSYYVTIRYLAPKIIKVDLQVPAHLEENLESYRYHHASIKRELTLDELALVWTTPNLVRTIPRYIDDWDKAKFAKIELSEINAWILSDEKAHPVRGAYLSYELNYGELRLPLFAVKELSMLGNATDGNAIAFSFGSSGNSQSEIIEDAQTGHLRWDLLGKSFLDEGKVMIGAELKSNDPARITTMILDL